MESLDRRLRSLERDMGLIRSAVVVAAEGEDGSSGSSRSGGGSAGASVGRRQQQQQPGPAQRWRQQDTSSTPQQPPAQQLWGQQQPQGQQAQQVEQSLWSQPISLRRALIGAGLLATASAAATALCLKRLQRSS
jgi:hypothetical protein